MVITSLTSKGQTTVPGSIRRHWQTREVYWEQCPDGSAIVRPVKDIVDLFGIAKSALPKDIREKSHARASMGRKA